MKKIGIITILKCKNFGAELQAYATQKKLQQLGYDAEIIDYLYYKHPRFHYTKRAKTVWKRNVKTDIVEYIKYQIVGMFLDIIVPVFNKKQRILDKRFDEFHKNNTKLSPTYRSIDELYSADMNYDVYIVGSDQVWNPVSSVNLSPYFLTFAPRNAKKISYASSFGVKKIQKEYKNIYSEWLNQMDYLAVREDSGIQIIKELTGRDAHLVLDPTLLLNKNDWSALEGGETPMPGYVLIYSAFQYPTIMKLAKQYAAEHHVKIYKVQTKAFFNKNEDGVINLSDCGPAEFVKLIKNAGLVLTSSFHAVAFSVNLGVDFYTVLPKARDNNSRITSLLRLLHLEDRLIYEGDLTRKLEWRKIDMPETQRILEIEREKSIKYLKDSIDA